MKYTSPSLKHFLDEKFHLGDRECNTQAYRDALKDAGDIAKSFIGCSIIVRQKSFTISMVELYYGSAGDDKHDWFRSNRPGANPTYPKQTQIQKENGLKVYIQYPNENDTYNRMDIVIGPQDVAISILIRSLIDSNDKTIQGPFKCMTAMNIHKEDHGKEIKFINTGDTIKDDNFYLCDSREIFYNKNPNMFVDCKHRKFSKGEISTIESNYRLMWNFHLSTKI
jgi:hypothetical protein